MKGYAYYNGKFGRTEEISVPLTDRAIYFGDGVYDVAIGRGEKLMLEDEHLERFLQGAQTVGITHSYNQKNLSELIHSCISASHFDSYRVYFQISRNSPRRIHTAKDCDNANLLITVDPFDEEKNDKPLRLITYPDKRYGYCHVKTLNLLPSVMASTAAGEANCDEAVFHRGSTVTECAHSNISILKKGMLYTHHENDRILAGICRRKLIEVCCELGIRCIQEPFELAELYTADEILITSTTRICARAELVDGVRVGCKDDRLYNAVREAILLKCTM